MIIAILIWTALVAATYYFADVILGFLTPGAVWLQANPDLAAWIEPVLGVAGTLGMSAAIITWLAGIALIALFGRGRARERIRRTLAYDEWRGEDGGNPAVHPARRRAWMQEPRRDHYDDDDDDRHRRSSRRRRRDDDDDDDDD